MLIEFRVKNFRSLRDEQVLSLVASSAKARKVLGWNPQYTDVEVVISTAWKWHQTHPEGYKK